MPDDNSRLVYSSDGGRHRGETASPKRKPAPQGRPRAADPADGVVRIHRTSKGRGGKTVTLVSGLPNNERALDALLKELKQHCGAGGTRDGAVLEIQGEHRERLRSKLEALGYSVKLAGG